MGLWDSCEFRRAFYPRLESHERGREMDGRDYIATVRLTSKAGQVLARKGDTCERVPERSLAWLIARGYVTTLTPEDREVVKWVSDMVHDLEFDEKQGE